MPLKGLVLLAPLLLVPPAAAAFADAAETSDACGGRAGQPNPQAGCRLALGRGVNLAVWLEYERAPGHWTTADDLARIRSLGFQHVRLPIDPIFYMTDDAPGQRTLHEERADALEDALDLIENAGLATILDLHPRSETTRAILSDPQAREEYAVFLHALAARLDPRHETLALSLLNEPSDPDGDATTPFDYNPIQRHLWQAARNGSPRLTLIATGDDWSSPNGLRRVTPLPDPNVIYDFHYYTPFLFTHQGAPWTWSVVKPLKHVPYPSTPQNIALALDHLATAIPDEHAREQVARHVQWYGDERWDAAKISAEIRDVATWAREKGVRVMLGEFGAYEAVAPDPDRATWTRHVREAAENEAIPWSYWNWDSDFGLVDHETEELHQGLAQALGIP